MIDIRGLDKAEVLQALYETAAAKGIPSHVVPGPLSLADAQNIIRARSPRPIAYEFLKGRALRVDLTDDAIDVVAYNAENGTGKADAQITTLRPRRA